tara:strand:+ start:4876 stop:5979 length:1104 start_codon:yes stop_codon:yes gene_type:complete
MKNYLNFETEVKELEAQLDELRDPFSNEGITQVNTNEIATFEEKINNKLESIYANLNPWQITQVARHEERPKARYFIENLFDDFIELSGDRFYGEDKSVITGFAKFNNKSVLVIGQEKGENLEERLDRNFGMMRPEGYRKSIRLMELANKFNIPIITFIDTPGAYPGVGAEERGQAEAIARSIESCMKLKVPNISIIIGEGGSGGAIALASASKVLMLENAIYSVISPEGCATILWRDPKKTLEAATAMKLTSKELYDLNIVDEIIKEPIGGAHRDREKILYNVKSTIKKYLENYESLNAEEIILQRKNKFLKIGRDKGFTVKSDDNSGLSFKKSEIAIIFDKILNNRKFILPAIVLTAIILIYYFL